MKWDVIDKEMSLFIMYLAISSDVDVKGDNGGDGAGRVMSLVALI
jgi:hypothetical protein